MSAHVNPPQFLSSDVIAFANANNCVIQMLNTHKRYLLTCLLLQKKCITETKRISMITPMPVIKHENTEFIFNEYTTFVLANVDETDKSYPECVGKQFHLRTLTVRYNDPDYDQYIFSPKGDMLRTNTTDLNVVIMAEDFKSINTLFNFVGNAMIPQKQKNTIYHWSPRYSQYHNDQRVAYSKNINDIIGAENYFYELVTDITRYVKNRTEMVRLGVSNGYNVLLYGEPGTGKTSFARALSTHFEIPIYVASLTGNGNSDISDILMPTREKRMKYKQSDNSNSLLDSEDNDSSETYNIAENMAIVMIEDFDRCIEDENGKVISQLLNALDGVTPCFDLIRIFSANSTDVISKNRALTSRMNKIFKFARLDVSQIECHIKNVLKQNKIDFVREADKLKQLAIMFLDNGMNTREITYFLIRYHGVPHALDIATQSLDNWLIELNEFKNFKAEKLESIKKKTTAKHTSDSNPNQDTDSDTDSDSDAIDEQ